MWAQCPNKGRTRCEMPETRGSTCPTLFFIGAGVLGMVGGAVFLIVAAVEFKPDALQDHKRDESCVEADWYGPNHEKVWECKSLHNILDQDYNLHGLAIAGIVLVCLGFVVMAIVYSSFMKKRAR